VSLLRKIDQAVPGEMDIHCIVDNCATHRHPKIKSWLASQLRWRVHFSPTYNSWLNQDERFFASITDKAIRRGSLRLVYPHQAAWRRFHIHHAAVCILPPESTSTFAVILSL